ncbi:putative ankyrin repeat-containing domain, PGG domain, ankyrin repeat-containing domain superfamily [Helianthus debilis subsp. tardiflorus]
MGDWETAKSFFDKDEHALTDKLNFNGNRTLHVAIGNPENIGFLERLLDLIDADLLPSLVDDKQQNALHYAAALDNTLAAKKLVERNPHLLFAADYEKTKLPIHLAVLNSNKTTFSYLFEVCKQHIGLSQEDGYYNPFEGEKGVLLLNSTIWSGFLDVAYDLLKEYPELARTKYIRAPLWCIAKKWDAYPSAKRYNFYQRFVYSHVPIDNKGADQTSKINDIENQEICMSNLITQCTKSYVYPVAQRIYAKFWKVLLLHVPHIKHLQEDKEKHNIALMILNFICEEVGKLQSNQFEHYGLAFMVAVKNDTPEVIEQITKTIPQSIWVDEGGYRLPQVSILNRCENIFNFLVHEVTHDKNLLTTLKDKDENNLLHLAGRLAPKHKLSMVTGATLQMQRELQWFQEVSKLVRPSEREATNLKEETPIMIFRKEHKALRQEGEEWMKKTADSYTITAALIITIVFAAAITVPGGNNGDTGKPLYETRLSFIIFAASDAISLFTSTTSLLLFLSILTARYAEEDFLYKLPNRLILGLVMLFMSVTSMMIAFSATLYIMFGQQKSWILIPIIALTCLPIASFVTLQLPLLVDLISSTYGHGIFGKKK